MLNYLRYSKQFYIVHVANSQENRTSSVPFFENKTIKLVITYSAYLSQIYIYLSALLFYFFLNLPKLGGTKE